MYPDLTTFQRMVDEENLSGAGRQTLLALYDGPLHLRQILDIVNTPECRANGKSITESALRKRLDLLISRGILARAGSERTNPYYYIRRPWIFNKYVLVRCRDKPGRDLLELTVLLHELSQMAAGGNALLPNPRFISAVGERTERSHQVGDAFASFEKLLGNKTAIGDYLEEIYEDIYEGNVPASDIDALVARDFLRFVATAPDEEREVQLFFWYADFFHILDRYPEAFVAFRRGVSLASEQGLDLPAILSGIRISEGHILLHLNDFTGAKEAFLKDGQMRGISPSAKAKSLLGAGEAGLVMGDPGLPVVRERFTQALALCTSADPGLKDPDILELRADIVRRLGSVHRLLGNLYEAEACYREAERIFEGSMPRSLVMLLPERGELLRARACTAPPGEAGGYLAGAEKMFEEAKAASQRIRNITGYASCLVGECETARIAYERNKTPLPKNLNAKYANAFEIYCQISSRWGIVQTFISEALLYRAAPEVLPEMYAVTADKLAQAEVFSKELGLGRELALIRRLKSGENHNPELNPLTFL
jgi:tetratricopeptide (TPR) repeat protein